LSEVSEISYPLPAVVAEKEEEVDDIYARRAASAAEH
jgi:hypothetical protein